MAVHGASRFSGSNRAGSLALLILIVTLAAAIPYATLANERI